MNNNEEQATKIIGYAQVKEEPQKWYFTFGYDHSDSVTGVRLHNKYCVVEGTHDETRDVILKRFGRSWCMQYGHADDVPEPERKMGVPHFKYRGAGVEKYNLELFDHVTSAAVIGDELFMQREVAREKAGYYDPEA